MLIFLKLGGSLITDKSKVSTPRLDILKQVSGEIAGAWQNLPEMQLILGHGSGSFGHVPGNKYQTRCGVSTKSEWGGFVEVWREARLLNQIVVESLLDAGLPMMAFPPSALYRTTNGKIKSGFVTNITTALSHNIIPLVNGDVIFDDKIGGTILSTEEIFIHLASTLKPDRILLAGIEKGVWSDYPESTRLIHEITPRSFNNLLVKPGTSSQVDVTGGMHSKVLSMLNLIKTNEKLEALIFSGEQKGNITSAFNQEMPGTVIRG